MRAPHAIVATQSKDSDNTSLCYRCGQTGHWAKICKASLNVANAYKLYREASEANNLEQENDEEDVDMRVDDFEAGRSDDTQDFA